jgi:nucleoid DNA-binding protein
MPDVAHRIRRPAPYQLTAAFPEALVLCRPTTPQIVDIVQQEDRVSSVPLYTGRKCHGSLAVRHDIEAVHSCFVRRRTCPILVSVTKAQLAEQLAPALELSKEKAEKTVEAVFAAIVKALKDGEKLDIRGFGNFKVKDQPARQARNPRTGEPIAVPAKKVAVFKPGKELAEALNPPVETPSGASTVMDPTL